MMYEKNQFILLHDYDDNTPVLINLNSIICIYKNDKETVIKCINDFRQTVHESIEKIYKMIQQQNTIDTP